MRTIKFVNRLYEVIGTSLTHEKGIPKNIKNRVVIQYIVVNAGAALCLVLLKNLNSILFQ